jgi:hypothetical protein
MRSPNCGSSTEDRSARFTGTVARPPLKPLTYIFDIEHLGFALHDFDVLAQDFSIEQTTDNESVLVCNPNGAVDSDSSVEYLFLRFSAFIVLLETDETLLLSRYLADQA